MKKRAFVRYSKQGKVVPGSLILTAGSYPNGPSVWKEVPADLCCGDITCPTPDFGAWKLVTGGTGGDGVGLVDGADVYTLVGPNDSTGDGWIYLTKYFATETCVGVGYDYMSFDGLEHDYPVYWVSSTEPTGEPGDTTNRATSNPESGTWEGIVVPAGQWFSIGLYSDDSCCGRGFLTFEVYENPCPTTTTTTVEPFVLYFANYSTASGPGACYAAQDQFNIYTVQAIGLGSGVFTDGTLSTLAPNGYYSTGGSVYTVTSGLVTAVGTCPATSAFNYTINIADLANATGNTDTALNGKVFAMTADDGSGNPNSKVFTAAGVYNHWLCSANPIVPTFGYYASDVFVTAGLMSTQVNGGAC